MTDTRAARPAARPTSSPSLPSPAQLRRIACQAADDVGPALATAFRTAVETEEKTSAHDLVTWHDSSTEERLVELLTAAVPDSRITGEEGGAQGSGAVEWIVDPIDGTSNFAHGFAMFSVSIAAAVDGEVVAGVVHDPSNGLTFSADDAGAWLRQADGERPLTGRAVRHTAGEQQLNLVTSYPSAEALQIDGAAALETLGEAISTFSTVRRLVSGALELCHAAAGWADVVFGVDTSPWDVAAGMLILRRAGGTYEGLGAGADTRGDHLAPHYLALAPGVDSPTARRLVRGIAERRAG
ncbi:inositol monophosphatase family protein [Nesterenkonia sp. HG001]|uniref:inositol monophosphatase family protein n=1 Tax=Nesterenkonia sp. HG001 TaxID=2983207 RepID=UPI002AC4A43E|nr:inositol monophosphatase family protein [Nesterenkonia sp. HG001]MDZ5079004.1 inositol monophosphatase [Nesterenkonia sp. HG001]